MITDKETLDKLNKMTWKEISNLYPNQRAVITDYEWDNDSGYSKFKIHCLGSAKECAEYLSKHPLADKRHTIAHTTYKLPEGVLCLW